MQIVIVCNPFITRLASVTVQAVLETNAYDIINLDVVVAFLIQRDSRSTCVQCMRSQRRLYTTSHKCTKKVGTGRTCTLAGLVDVHVHVLVYGFYA